MFVRWKRKKIKVKKRAADLPLEYLKYAQLVQTSWETGHPRQKVIKYLGSIRESNLFSTIHQKRFWQNVQDNLNQLQLAYNEKERIIDKLSEVVPMNEGRRNMKNINLVEIQEVLKKWDQNNLMTMAMVLEILDKAEVIVKREGTQILLTEMLKIRS